MMKKIIIFVMLSSSGISYSQSNFNNWITVGGNNNRSGYSDTYFDASSGISRTFLAPFSLWGMPVFCYNGKFVTTRYTSLSPIRALIAAYNFSGSSPFWTYGENSGVNIVMGFNNDKVYVRDFQQNGSDTIFAINANTGSIVWKSRFTVERGIIWTAVFASNGDLILPGSGTNRIMRINYTNGDTVWTNSRIIPNTGAECMCINGNTLYALQGGITTPKTILAIEMNTGITKYASAELPGDGDQEIPFTVSFDGVVYCIRDGGLMYAVKDNGSALNILWSRYVPQPVGTYSQIAVGKDSSVYIPFGRKIYRLNPVNGAALDSSIELAASGTINPRFAIGKFSNVFVGNGASEPSEGKFFIFNKHLESLIAPILYPYNYYCGPSFGGYSTSPNFLYTGAGTEIKSIFNIIDNVGLNSSVPGGFSLQQNYPNPFNPKTIINYQLAMSNNVLLKVYDVLGNEITTLVNEKQNPGRYEVEFDGKNLSSGIYFYKLTIESSTETRKMNLIK